MFSLNFFPLMTELGILWQTEQFVLHMNICHSLIKQKIHVQTEKIQNKKSLEESSPNL